MNRYRHVRILPIPNGDTIPGSWLENFRIEKAARFQDLILDYQAFHCQEPPILIEENGRPRELLYGTYSSCRLRFNQVTDLVRDGLYRNVELIPMNHPARSLRGMFYWRTREGRIECILLNASDEPADLQFSSPCCVFETRQEGKIEPVEIIRDWSAAPQHAPGLVPDPLNVHRRFGGDPVTFHLDGKKFTQRLFVGGLENQLRTRPAVDAVLNLGEEPSIWYQKDHFPADRWVKKGEGRKGMLVDEIKAEASWVIDRLRAGKRVLVHCWAGMNRSATIVCAVLILLEGLSAEDALNRVREKHPWARPDSNHWLMLRWIAKK